MLRAQPIPISHECIGPDYASVRRVEAVDILVACPNGRDPCDYSIPRGLSYINIGAANGLRPATVLVEFTRSAIAPQKPTKEPVTCAVNGTAPSSSACDS